MSLQGKVWRYGDNIDTDVIIPARYLNSFDPKELAEHCMVDIDESFAKNVQEGDIMVGGKNFGCGSSREHAPVAIKGCRFSRSAMMWRRSARATSCASIRKRERSRISRRATSFRRILCRASCRRSPKRAV